MNIIDQNQYKSDFDIYQSKYIKKFNLIEPNQNI